MLHTFIPGYARIIPVVAIASMGLAASSLMAATNVTVGLNGKSFGHGQSLKVESTGLLDPSKAYTSTLQGTLKGTGVFAFINGKTLAELLEIIEPGSSSKLTKIKDNPTGALPFTQLSKNVYNGTIASLGVSVSLTIASKIDETGKVIIEVKNISIVGPLGPIPGKITFGDKSNLRVTTAPEIRFNIANQNVNENAGSVKVKVVRWGFVSSAASASFTMTDGTAKDGKDYTKKEGTVSFAAGITEAFINVPIADTPEKDGKRSFTITLSNPNIGAAIGNVPSTTVNIFNVN